MEQWMAEAAEEELRALEAHHPNRFSSLKLHLKALISDSSSPPTQQPSSDLCSTQASSTCVGNNGKRKRKRKDRADLALERAEECLEKIRRVKESLAWW